MIPIKEIQKPFETIVALYFTLDENTNVATLIFNNLPDVTPLSIAYNNLVDYYGEAKLIMELKPTGDFVDIIISFNNTNDTLNINHILHEPLQLYNFTKRKPVGSPFVLAIGYIIDKEPLLHNTREDMSFLVIQKLIVE